MLGAPISTILIVFELTRNYDITLGVMTAAAFASTVMQWSGHGSFFRWQLSRRDINIASDRDISLLMTHRVEQLITQRFTRCSSSTTVGELELRMAAARHRVGIIMDDNDVFLGSVQLSELVSHAMQQGLDQRVNAAAYDASYAISASTNIVTALQRMAEKQAEYIPVTDTHTESKSTLLGVVLKNDLLTEHYDVVKRAREEEFGIN